ncbi:hypothetical protein D3C85_1302880 [compost metagenome]
MTVAGHQQQTGDAGGYEVVIIASLPGALVGVTEVAVEHVVAQGAPTTAIHGHPAGIAADLLQSQIQRMATQVGREQPVASSTLHVTNTGAAVIVIDEVAQIRAESPVTKLLFM